MPIGRSHPRLQPIRHLDELDSFVGKWVAVKKGRVVAAAKSSRALAYELHKGNIRGAVAQYVPEPSDSVRVGLG